MKRDAMFIVDQYCEGLAAEIELSLATFGESVSIVKQSSPSVLPKDPTRKQVQLASVFFPDVDVQSVIFHMLHATAFSAMALRSGISISGRSRGSQTTLQVDFDVAYSSLLTGEDVVAIYRSMVENEKPTAAPPRRDVLAETPATFARKDDAVIARTSRIRDMRILTSSTYTACTVSWTKHWLRSQT
jgi:hypothetical protein